MHGITYSYDPARFATISTARLLRPAPCSDKQENFSFIIIPILRGGRLCLAYRNPALHTHFTCAQTELRNTKLRRDIDETNQSLHAEPATF